MDVKYFARKPCFPIILNINGCLHYAMQGNDIIKILSCNKLEKDETVDIIDFTNEGWIFYNDLCIISPLTLEKTYTKKQLINLFNNRKNKNDQCNDLVYEDFKNKTFDKLFLEIINRLKYEKL